MTSTTGVERKKKDKRVPINSIIRPIIKRLLKESPESEYLFVSPRTGTKFTSVKNSWNGILKEAGLNGKPGVDRLRFHDLRHTFISILLAKGVNPRDVQSLARHASLIQTNKYSHEIKDRLQGVVKELRIVTTDENQTHHNHS